MSRTTTTTASIGIGAWLKDLAALFKLRLTSLVVFSAALGFAMGLPAGGIDWAGMVVLCVAGLLVTGSSNAFNQVLEVEADSLMKRTADRPLVRRSMATNEAVIAALLAGATGVTLLWAQFGRLTGVLGLLSLFMYVALYTPMKKHSSWAVFIGAFPGAFPPMLGYVAATGHFDLGAGLLFAMQFMWQFPHFWSIAWVLNDDYAKAGYFLLPGKGGRDRSSSFLILLYTLFVIPAGALPWYFHLTGVASLIVTIVCGAVMLWPAFRLFFTHDVKDARRLMFASFLYLPAVQLAYVLDKL